MRWTTAVCIAALAASTSCDRAGEGARHAQEPPADSSAAKLPFEFLAQEAARPTRVQMRNVYFHLPEDIVLRIHRMEGEMRATQRGQPISFDDAGSFSLEISEGVLSMGTQDLERLMNDWIFDYDGAPMRDIRITTKGDRLVQKGVLDGPLDAGFEMEATPELMPSGEIRLRPEKIKVLGINTGGLMRILDIDLDEIMDVSGAKGVRLDGNDLVLDPAVALPPPRLKGRLTSIRVQQGELVQVFGDPEKAETGPGDSKSNFMLFTGGLLAFGKLLMVGADMLVIDGDPSDPFDFSLAEYEKQLVAGYSETMSDRGLRVRMPDLDEVRANGRAAVLRRPAVASR